MATVQSYTKSGVDAKFNSRSNMTMVHNGGGSPDIEAYPDSKTGDVIERASDGARWGVVASTINPIAGRVVSVAGKTGVVTLGPGDVGASPSSHTHTKAQISDLNASTSATSNSVAQRGTNGVLVVGTPTATTHATTKAYVDSRITGGITWANLSGKPSTFTPSSHTHTMANITDLPSVATTITNNAIVRRTSSGQINVHTTPGGAQDATSKAYVDSRITGGITWGNLSGKPTTFPPASHTHTVAQITNLNASTTADPNSIARRTSSGQMDVPLVPTGPGDAASKKYVDDTITAGATWSSLAGKPSTFPPSTHTHTVAQISNLKLSQTAAGTTVVERDSSGRITVATPTSSSHAATKAYVDSSASAASSWSAITGKPSTFTPSTHTHSYNQITNRPRFDMGYGSVSTDTTPTEFPAGVSYALSNAGTLGWNEAILEEVPNALLPSFWMIQTSRQTTYDGATVQMLYSYNRAGIPIYTRTWDHDLEAWGPIRAITDDGHKHRSSDVSDSVDVLHANYPSRLLKTRADGQLYIYTDTITNGTHATNKAYVDQRINTRAATSHTHTSANITDAVTHASGTTTNGNKLLKTDSSGRVTASNPTSTSHVANKNYVDSVIDAKTTWANTSGKPSTFPPSSHTHTVAQISNLTLSQTATGSSVVQRDSSGRATVATPTATGHATTKAYVDNAVTAAKAWSAITGKPSTFTPSSHTHTMAQISNLPTVGTGIAGGAVVQRDTSGHILVHNAPSANQHAASKNYVDRTLDAKFESEALATQNLNDITIPGNYAQRLSTNATTARNYPDSAEAGHLIVTRNDDLVMQEYTNFNSTSKYYRTKYRETWYPWEQIAGQTWFGTQTQYDAITTKSSSRLYIIT